MTYHIPDLVAPSFTAIDFSAALSEGRRFLCLDLDNTLLPQKGHQVPESVARQLHTLRQSGQVEEMCLISNVIFPGHRLTRLHRLARELEIPHVVPGFFWNRKPMASPFLQALRLLQARPSQCVMVGDQIYSDILGGNRLGMYTVWVLPMASDHWSTLLTGRRRREARLLRQLERQGRADPTWSRHPQRGEFSGSSQKPAP